MIAIAAGSPGIYSPPLPPEPPGSFDFNPSGTLPNGRLSLYARPQPGMSYCLGFDTARGIEGKDFDAAVLLDGEGAQAAELHGHWGESFGTIMMPLLDWFAPLVVGEATEMGTVILRQLYDAGRYHLYFNRAESTRGRKIRDMLGHAPTANDRSIVALQQAIAPRDERGNRQPGRLTVRSAELHSQLCRFSFRPRSSSKTFEEVGDIGLTWGSPDGEHDDLVRALALANYGLACLPKFQRPKPALPANSMGKLVGIDALGQSTHTGPRASYWGKTNRR